jgi:hypothetical protein
MARYKKPGNSSVMPYIPGIYNRVLRTRLINVARAITPLAVLISLDYKGYPFSYGGGRTC